MDTVSPSDSKHLFGSRKSLQDPLHLSIPLDAPRRLTVDEAAQICERGTAIQPSTRDSWQIEPYMDKGKKLAALSRMSMRGGRHAEATWDFPISEGVGHLRLSCPIDAARYLSDEECRQLRSFDPRFARANRSWVVKPSLSSPQSVEILRYDKRKSLLVGKLALAFALPVAQDEPQKPSLPRPLCQLSARSQACLSVLL